MTLADTQTVQATHTASDETVLTRKILLTVLAALIGWGLAVAHGAFRGSTFPRWPWCRSCMSC